MLAKRVKQHPATKDLAAPRPEGEYPPNLEMSTLPQSPKLSDATSQKKITNGGERGIRTPGTVTRTAVFETVPFDRSGTSPGESVALRQDEFNLSRLVILFNCGV